MRLPALKDSVLVLLALGGIGLGGASLYQVLGLKKAHVELREGMREGDRKVQTSLESSAATDRRINALEASNSRWEKQFKATSQETSRFRAQSQSFRSQVSQALSLVGEQIGAIKEQVDALTNQVAATSTGPAEPAGRIEASPPGGHHTIKPGETLEKIARHYRVTIEALMAANPGVDPRRLQIDQSIRLP